MPPQKQPQESTKPCYKSRTVWGILVTALAGLAAILDIGFSSEEVAGLSQAFAVISGAALALFGRARARLGLRLARADQTNDEGGL